MPRTKVINGKSYIAIPGNYTKAEANSKADYWRKHGSVARVIKQSRGNAYTVYISHVPLERRKR